MEKTKFSLFILCAATSMVLGDVAGNDPSTATGGTNSTADEGPVSKRLSLFPLQVRCFFACKLPNSPVECQCDSRNDCSTKVCGSLERCRMYLGRIPQCVKDKSVCGLAKSSVPCESKSSAYYFDRDTRKCEQFNTGECSSNGNSFRSMKECSKTCRPRNDFDFMRGEGNGRMLGRGRMRGKGLGLTKN